MERDFMGLKSKEPMIKVKEEVVETCKEPPGFARSSGMPWPMCNKVPALPHFMTFKAAGDEKMSKVMSENFSASGMMAMPAADAFETNHKHQSGEFQTNLGARSKQQFLGPHQILLSSNFLAGSTDSWYTMNPAGSPAQMTIFYGGRVNVFQDITPEKAQAIMLLAGSCSVSQPIAPKRLEIQSPLDKLVPKDAGFGNPVMNTPPSSAISSPISVSSHPVGQIASAPARNDEDAKPPKTIGISANFVNKMEPSSTMMSLGPVSSSPTMIPSAVPQFRKASLARFLEKRKERVMNSSPYNLMKKSLGDSKPEPHVAGVSAGGSGPSSNGKGSA